MSTEEAKLTAINLDPKVIKDLLTGKSSKKVREKLCHLADLAGGKTEKKEGHMLYELSSRLIKFPSVDPFS
mgnify:FL=1|jgi:hypothetical protein|tara:strand:- start:2188 stop:2400 length:213 start_codon:yes stop_codon:yes gene_type:complete